MDLPSSVWTIENVARGTLAQCTGKQWCTELGTCPISPGLNALLLRSACTEISDYPAWNFTIAFTFLHNVDAINFFLRKFCGDLQALWSQLWKNVHFFAELRLVICESHNENGVLTQFYPNPHVYCKVERYERSSEKNMNVHNMKEWNNGNLNNTELLSCWIWIRSFYEESLVLFLQVFSFPREWGITVSSRFPTQNPPLFWNI